MPDKKNILWGFVDAVGVFAYISLVALFFFNVEKIFVEKEDSFFAPVFFLLLFVISACITGALVLGRPVWLYLNGFKKGSVMLLAYTVAWLFVLLLLAFALNIVF